MLERRSPKFFSFIFSLCKKTKFSSHTLFRTVTGTWKSKKGSYSEPYQPKGEQKLDKLGSCSDLSVTFIDDFFLPVVPKKLDSVSVVF